MKKVALLLVPILAFAPVTRADDNTLKLQQQLRAQGLYRGPLDGNASSDLAAALRRYQTRSGLEVTGTLNESTAKALQEEPAPTAIPVSPVPSAAPVPRPASPAPSPQTKPPASATPATGSKPSLPAETAASPSVAPAPESSHPPDRSPSTSLASPSPPAPPSPAPTDQARITKFLKDYLRDGETNNLEAQLGYYTFPVQYFAHGRVGADFVRNDTAGYVRRWHSRHYLLIEPIKITRISPNEVKVLFTIAYEVKNNKRTARGRTSNELTLKEEGDLLHITAIQEKHLRN